MHPGDHSKTSARLFGGEPAEYTHIHQHLDASKEHFCDFRHRTMRHHAEGIFECERIFGVSFVNSVGKTVYTRYVAEQHVKEDCGGRIPTIADWLSCIQVQPWMAKGYPELSATPTQPKEKHEP
jgi:hypothetical protein